MHLAETYILASPLPSQHLMTYLDPLGGFSPYGTLFFFLLLIIVIMNTI